MRIGQFLTHFPISGGTTTAVDGWSEALARLGHQVFVYGHGPELEASESTFTTRLFRRRGPRGRDPLKDLILRNGDRLDVLELHGVFSYRPFVLAKAAEAAGIRRIFCPHDPYSSELFGTRTLAKRLYWSAFERRMLEDMTAVHVLAPSHRGLLQDRGIATPSFVVPPGIDPLPASDAPSDPRPPGSSFEILYMGRWDVYNKGLDLLLQAVAMDPRLRDEVAVRITGRSTASQERSLQRLVRKNGLVGCVQLEGFVPDKLKAMQSADLLVLPSRFDGFAQVVLEALAVGTPALVSTQAGVSEFVGLGHGAMVVEPSATEVGRGLISAMERIDEMSKAARGARDFVERTFTWDVLARSWLDEVAGLESAS